MFMTLGPGHELANCVLVKFARTLKQGILERERERERQRIHFKDNYFFAKEEED